MVVKFFLESRLNNRYPYEYMARPQPKLEPVKRQGKEKRQREEVRRFDFACDVVGLLGLGGVFYGVYQIHQPAAFITVGAVLFLLAIFAARH